MKVELIESEGDSAQFLATGVKGLRVGIVAHVEYLHGNYYFPADEVVIERTCIDVGEICGEESRPKIDLSREQNAEIELAIEKYIEEEKR